MQYQVSGWAKLVEMKTWVRLPLFPSVPRVWGRAGAMSLFIQELSVWLVNWPGPTATISLVTDCKPDFGLLPLANVRTDPIHSQRKNVPGAYAWVYETKRKVVLSGSLQDLCCRSAWWVWQVPDQSSGCFNELPCGCDLYKENRRPSVMIMILITPWGKGVFFPAAATSHSGLIWDFASQLTEEQT